MKWFFYLSVLFFSTQVLATPPCNGAKGAPHINGGGFVASTAIVTETYVGPGVQVCNQALVSKSLVSGSAKILGNAEVSKTTVSGNTSLLGNAKVSE